MYRYISPCSFRSAITIPIRHLILRSSPHHPSWRFGDLETACCGLAQPQLPSMPLNHIKRPNQCKAPQMHQLRPPKPLYFPLALVAATCRAFMRRNRSSPLAPNGRANLPSRTTVDRGTTVYDMAPASARARLAKRGGSSSRARAWSAVSRAEIPV